MELERQRATTVTAAKIARESAAQKAQAELFTSNTKADAVMYSRKADIDADVFRQSREADVTFQARSKGADAAKYEAEAKAGADYLARSRGADAVKYEIEARAEADFLRETRLAEAHLQARAKQAQATFLERKAEADGLLEIAKGYGALSAVLGGPQNLMQYIMIRDGLFEKMALANAKAINGLQPKINVWSTGSSTDAADPTAPIRNLFQCLPPMLSTINDQTGLSPPAWLMQMPPREQALELAGKPKMNGHINGV